MNTIQTSEETDECTPLPRRNSMKRLVRQTSIMDTQKDVDGSMKLTYWF